MANHGIMAAKGNGDITDREDTILRTKATGTGHGDTIMVTSEVRNVTREGLTTMTIVGMTDEVQGEIYLPTLKVVGGEMIGSLGGHDLSTKRAETGTSALDATTHETTAGGVTRTGLLWCPGDRHGHAEKIVLRDEEQALPLSELQL